MRELVNFSTDPHYNLALEEYILTAKVDEYFFLWQDQPAIIVGRNQNTSSEINEEYVNKAGIQVVRRLTGGGAVYHDLGNLNFTLIVNDADGVGFDFERFTRPIVNALASAGIAADYTGRNDLTIAGKKFSGNAQYRHKGRLLHHGTLLFNSDLTVLGAALKVKPGKIEAKGVKSVISRVTNIIDYAPGLTLGQFKELISQWLRQEYQVREAAIELTPDENMAVSRLTEEKYNTWSWNYGNSPQFNRQRSERFAWGEIEVYLGTNAGVINSLKIYGDFFAAGNLNELEQSFIGVKYEPLTIRNLIASLNIDKYLPQIDKGVFYNLIID